MPNLEYIKTEIQLKAQALGFQQARISDLDTSDFFPEFEQWVKAGYHGNMGYLARNIDLRADPGALHPGSCRIISLRYNYLPQDAGFTSVLKDPNIANISRYALGRDYHKLMRKKLQLLAQSISKLCEDFDYRVFVDSAPVLETSFAEKSGLGWKGKHTLVINKEAGSWFFLAEIFINLPLAIDQKEINQCGACVSCIKLCPTGAIIAPYKVDARKCISYLTIENQEAIPTEYRKLIGNRIYGCDDCQLACPWNRFSSTTEDRDFSPRHNLQHASLLTLFQWSEEEFYKKLEGNPIRRIGYQSWLRNIAVALGNGDYSIDVIDRLKNKRTIASAMVIEHIDWAIAQLETSKMPASISAKTEKLIRSIEKMSPRDA